MESERPLRILIVEDDPVDREIYKRSLQLSTVWGFEFAESDCATAGIEICRTWRPDCTLLDFNLPGIDGIELLTHFRTGPGGFPCAVVMLSAFGCEELAVRAMRAGAMDYLPKGQLACDKLPHTIVNAIRRFEMQQRIEEQRSALEKSARRHQALLEAIPQMVWTANAEGRLEYANHRWLEYTGLSLKEAARLGWDHLLHPDDCERTWSAWNQALDSGTVFEIEHRLRRASDGTYRWHLVRAVPVRSSGGEFTDWFGTCTEIEHQKQAATALLQKQKLEGIGLLAGGIAHDFNNLLVGIIGGASLAMESLPASHPVQEMLQDVIREGERAADLTRKMLAYAGKGNSYVETTRIDQLVRDSLVAMGGSIPKTIRLEFQSGPDLPPVKTNAEQMRHVVVDLVMNAVEAIGEGASGTISVQTAAVEISEESTRQSESRPGGIPAGRYVSLEVRDTGCGMDEETLGRIFDPFFTTKFTGRGLGLAAVHGFVRSNGGCVQVDSAPGKGTRFRVLLPAASEKEHERGAGC